MGETPSIAPSESLRPRRKRRARAPNHREEKAKRVLESLALTVFGITLIGSPLLLGGATPWAIWIIAGLSALSLLAAIAVRQPSVYQARVPVALALMIALGYTVVQAVPLPCALVRFISPNTAAEADATARVLGEHMPTMCTLSVDPGQTRIEIVKLTSVLACFLAAALFASSGMRRRVHSIIAISVIAMMSAAFLHGLLDLDRVFGVYKPIYAEAHVLVAPLLNVNHLAAFVGMGVPLLLAFGIREEFVTWRRMLWFIAAGLCALCACATLSKSGVGSTLVGIAAFIALLWSRRRRAKRTTRPIVIATVLEVIGFSIASATYFETAGNDVHARPTTRAAVAGMGLLMAAHNPVFGVGRGAFASAAARESGAQRRFIAPENIVAQWTSEWGFALALFLFFVVGRELAKRARIYPSTVSLAVLAGIVSLASHELFDFSLEMLGVSVVGAALFGSLVAPSGAKVDDFAEAPGDGTLFKHLVIPSLVAALVAAIVLGPMLNSWSVDASRDRLVSLMQAGDRRGFQATLVDAVHLHPAEPALALLAGAEAREHSDPQAAQWLNRAMVLAPGWASPHIEAAHFLFATGHRDQALLELREAALRDVNSPFPFVCDIVRAEASAALALRSVPTGPHRVQYLDLLAHCLPATSEAVTALDREITRIDPRHPSPRVREIRVLIAHHRVDDALAAARTLSRAHPRLRDAALVYGEALIAAHRYQEASEHLKREEPNYPDPSPLLRLRARAEAARGDAVKMREAIDELRGLASGSHHELASVMILQAQLETQLGNDPQALAAYNEAFEFQPHITILEALAICAERQGNRGKAYEAYTKLVEMAPNNATYRAARERLVGARSPLGL